MIPRVGQCKDWIKALLGRHFYVLWQITLSNACKIFDCWDKARWRKDIPFLNMARINFYWLEIVHSKWRMLRKWWQSLNYLFIGRWRRKSKIFVLLCMFMHNWNKNYDLRTKYKLNRNFLNINMKINCYFKSIMSLRQFIL